MNSLKWVMFWLCSLLAQSAIAQTSTRTNAFLPPATNMQVNTYTGGLYYEKDLFFLKGKGFDLDFSVFYNSNMEIPVSGLGDGWSHSFDINYDFRRRGGHDTMTCTTHGNVGSLIRYFNRLILVIRMPNGIEKQFIDAGTPSEYCGDYKATLVSPITGVFDSVFIGSGKLLLKTKYGLKYTFNWGSAVTNHQIQTIEDLNGNILSFSYNAANHLTKVTDASRRFLTFAWSGDRILSVTDANETPNRVIQFDYDNNLVPNLVKITNPLGKTIQLNYFKDMRRFLLSSVVDENSNATHISYKGIVSSVATCLTEYHFSFASNNANKLTAFVTEKTETEPQITTYEYLDGKNVSRNGNCCGYKVDFEYNAQSQISKRTDGNNHSTQYLYDAKGNLLQETDAGNCVAKWTYEPIFNRVASQTDRNGNVTQYTYDAKGNLIKIEHPLTVTELFEYDVSGNLTKYTDAKGNITTYVYNNHGYLTQINHPLNNYNRQYTYDNRGNRTTMTDENGNLTRYEYDLRNRLLKTTDALGQITTLKYDAKSNLVEATNPKNQKTVFIYDLLDRLIELQLPLNQVYQLTYDTRSNLVRMRDPRGALTTYQYNAKNLVEKVTNPLGFTTQYDYDAVGNRITRTDALQQTTRFLYDNNNRLTEIIDPLQFSTRYGYDCSGNVLTKTDANQHQMQWVYDALHRVTAQTDALNGISRFEYDKNNNLTKLTDANNHATTYDFDALNRNTVMTYADNSNKTFTYDGVGNVLTRLDGNLQTTRYTYDALHRLTKRDYPDANDDEFQYDAIGKLTVAKNAHAEIRWVYDSLNRLLSETLNGKTTQYAYDTRNGKRHLIYPSGKIIEESYDAAGQLFNLKEDGLFVAGFGYDSLGRMTARRYANNTATAYEYDANHRLTRLTHHPNAFIDLKYTYDKVGNVLTQTYVHKPERSEKYGYDANDRLTGYQKGVLANGTIANPIQTAAYQYDALGNRTTTVENGVTTTYETNSMNAYTRITGGQTATLRYDGNGNLLTDGVSTFVYDFENRLQSATKNSQSIGYQYDALKRRVSKTVGGQANHYAFNQHNFIEATDNQGQTVVSKIATSRLDDGIAVTTATGKSFIQSGKFNSVLALTNEAGAAQQLIDYQPFGQPNVYNSATPNPNHEELFTGRFMDTASNLVDLRSREYSAGLGRFLQRDMIGYGDGLNMYVYVDNNPIKYFDPLGTFKICFYDVASERMACSNTDDFNAPETIIGVYSGGGGRNNLNQPKFPHKISNSLYETDFKQGSTPHGTYKLGHKMNHKKLGPSTFPLIPDKQTRQRIKTYNRDPDSFRFHEDNKYHNKSASEGCIVTKGYRKKTLPIRDDFEEGDIIIVH